MDYGVEYDVRTLMKNHINILSSEEITRRDILKFGLKGSAAAWLADHFWGGGCKQSLSKKRPNIILISLDTTRVDHLSCYGYSRKTSPNLDKLAQESVIYSRAIATSSWTLPSHASLFTGKFTSSHGVRYDSDGPLRLMDAIKGPEAWNVYRARGLAPSFRKRSEGKNLYNQPGTMEGQETVNKYAPIYRQVA